MDLLKDCPFCGGKAKLGIIGNDFTKKRCCVIKCTKCHIKMTVCVIRFSLDWASEQVIKQWNSRIGYDR